MEQTIVFFFAFYPHLNCSVGNTSIKNSKSTKIASFQVNKIPEYKSGDSKVQPPLPN